MVEVETVLRALDAADARQRPVQRIAQPVDDEQSARNPEPDEAVVRQGIGGADRERCEDADGGQVIGENPARQPGGDPAKKTLLGLREEERRISYGLDGFLGLWRGHENRYARRRSWFRSLYHPGNANRRDPCRSRARLLDRVLSPEDPRKGRRAFRDRPGAEAARARLRVGHLRGRRRDP